MVYSAGYAEAYVKLGLYHDARLPDLKLYGQKLSVADRARSRKLAAEQLCKLLVLRQAFVLDAVSDADYRIARRYIKLRIKLVCLVLNKLCADLRRVKVYVLLHKLKLRFLARRNVFERARTDRSYLRTQHGDGYDGHDLAARCRLDKFYIGRFGIIYKFCCI